MIRRRMTWIAWPVATIGVIVTAVLIGTGAMADLLNLDAGDYAQASGQLHVGENTADAEAIVKYEENWRQPATCAAQLLGYDDKYLYAMVACGTYSNLHTPQAKMDSGFEVDGRYEYRTNPLRVVNHEYVGEDNEDPSDKQVFPKPIVKKYHSLSFGDIRSTIPVFTILDKKARS